MSNTHIAKNLRIHANNKDVLNKEYCDSIFIKI